MTIDPAILAQMEGARAVDMANRLLTLPALTGSPKQIKWATTIREKTVALQWPDDLAVKLRSIVDATWWIANKTIITTMKFKEPVPHQIVGGHPLPASTGRSKQPELGPQTSKSPAAQPWKRDFNPVLDALNAGKITPKPAAAAQLPAQGMAVFDSCVGFATSVSRNPKQAEATIIALLAKLYKPPIRDALQDWGRHLKAEAEFETGRDLDAINRLLG